MGNILSVLRSIKHEFLRKISWCTYPVYFIRGLRFRPAIDTRGKSNLTDIDDQKAYRSQLDGYASGPGIHKWTHYDKLYNRLMARNTGPISILEIGVQSGGSLSLWRKAFGPDAVLVGIDINPSCSEFTDGNTFIEIGSQVDATFLSAVTGKYGPFDVIIDDGSHFFHHQALSLELLLGSVKPGGVYIVEDIHGVHNKFSAMMFGIVANLNHHPFSGDFFNVKSSAIQRYIENIEFGAF